MLKKILFSLALGIIATLYFAQNDQWVHDAVRSKLKATLQDAWNCHLEFEVESVNVFVPSVTLKNVHCYPKKSLPQEIEHPWSWEACHLTLTTSWLTFGLSSMVGLHIDVDTVKAHTAAQGNHIPLIHDHVVAMMSGASLDIPLYVKSLHFHKGTLHLQHAGAQAILTVQWSSESKSINGVFKTNGYLHDGDLSIFGRALLKRLHGDLRLNFTQTPLGLKSDCLVACTTDIQLRDNRVQPCSIDGQWKTDQGYFTITTADQSVMVQSLHIAHTPLGLLIDAKATASLSAALSVLYDGSWCQKVQGICAVNLHGQFSPEHQTIAGECTLNGISYSGVRLCDAATIGYTYGPAGLQGDVSIDYAPLGTMHGPWLWNGDKEKGFITLKNKGRIDIPGFSRWMVDKEKFTLNAHVDALGALQCSYQGEARNELTNSRAQSKGTLLWHDNLLTSKGQINRSLYECSFALKPSLALKKLTYTNAQGVALLNMHESALDSTQFQGELDIALLRSLGQQFLKYTIQGEGNLKLKGRINDAQLHMAIELKDGIIRLPQTYNFINACTAQVVCDAAQKNITIENLHCGLYRGCIDAARIIIQADDSYNLHYAYAPFAFESCLLNIKKDLFALFSGTLAISKKRDQLAHANGAFIIERSYVKENLFSKAFQKNIAGLTSLMIDTDKQDMSCDITIETKELLRVDTAFLEANAKLALHITNTVRDPKISGAIDIVSGSLAFPYKQLLITKGSIYFMPDQLFDPLIELVAKNKIKKYNISLQVTGSLLNHDISLESSPPLTDEQIIALLLVGSQEQSLNVVVPALLMQNLKSVLFDSEQSPLRLNAHFKSWLKPFKNINLVPSFSDQTGRGGLRGAIEIEINDRWRAMAQKNFSLSEDTRFEVEYSLSDDVTLRGIRNERKDVAGEVEMRWKFGR